LRPTIRATCVADGGAVNSDSHPRDTDTYSYCDPNTFNTHANTYLDARYHSGSHFHSNAECNTNTYARSNSTIGISGR
jgi:hypothetical protein